MDRIFKIMGLLLIGVVSTAFANTLLSIYGIGEPLDIQSARTEALGGLSLSIYDGYNHTIKNPSLTTQFEKTVLTATYYRYQNKYNLEGTQSSYVNHNLPYFAFTIMLPGYIPLTVSYQNRYDWGYKVIEEFEEEGVSGLSKGIGSGTVNTFSFGGSYGITDSLSFGGRFDLWYGTPKRVWTKEFDDEDYTGVRDIINYHIKGIGFSLGGTYKIRKMLTVGGFYEYVGELDVERKVDNYYEEFKVEKGVMKYPSRFGIGVSFTPSKKMLIGLDMTYSMWSSSYFMDDPRDYRNTFGINAGFEYYFTRNPKSFFLKRMPIRVGLLYKPWYDTVDVEGGGVENFKEWGLTFGTGFSFVENENSTIDVACKFINRSSEGTEFLDESVYQLYISFSGMEKWLGKLVEED